MAGRILSNNLFVYLSRFTCSCASLSSSFFANHCSTKRPALHESERVSTYVEKCANTLTKIHQENLKFVGSLFSWGKFSHAILPRPCSTHDIFQIRGYQNVLRPRLMCEGCYFVWRHGRKHVECSDLAKHKQMKKLAPRKVWKEDYSKGKIKKAIDWHKKAPRQFLRTADKTALTHNWVAEKLGKEL